MRNLNYRRINEKLHLKRRKHLVNSIKNWNLNDEQVKVGIEDPISWWANEYWSFNQKKKNSRTIRHHNKIKLKKFYEE